MKKAEPLGLRWPVERTNAWLAAFGQLRRNTDRTQKRRDAWLYLGAALLIVVKLVDRAGEGFDPTSQSGRSRFPTQPRSPSFTADRTRCSTS